MAIVVTSFAFIDWADEGIMVSCKPSFPFGTVYWITDLENVIEERLDSIEKYLSRIDIMEIDKRAWDGPSFNRALGSVSVVVGNVRCSDSIFLFILFTHSEEFVDEKIELSKSFVSFAYLDTSSVNIFVQSLCTDLDVFERAKSVIKVTTVSSIAVNGSFGGPWAGEWWPAGLFGVAEVSFFALAGETGVGVDAVGSFVTGMGSFSTFISWTGTLFTVSDVTFFCSAFASVTIGQISAVGIFVAIMCS